MRGWTLLTIASALCGCSTSVNDRAKDLARAVPRPAYIFAWAADADGQDSDFLAVIDASPDSASYGKLITTKAVGVKKTMAHHTEPELHESGFLLANGFEAGTTFRFDLRNPTQPEVAEPLSVPVAFEHAHSFVRLPDGRILATYQYKAKNHDEPGGLVEYDRHGNVLRTGSAVDASSAEFVRPYSVAASTSIDRVVTTGNDMHKGSESRAVQIWRLSTLSLLSTIILPAGPRGNENGNSYEPRFLADGRTAMVSTRNCGLYKLGGLGTVRPAATLVYTFDDSRCFVPLVIGQYWIQALGTKPEIVVLDMSAPAQPKEVSRTRLLPGDIPHWLSGSPDGRRVVITGFEGLKHRLLVADFDRNAGELLIDQSFGDGGVRGFSFHRSEWPHGQAGPAIPHGSVFSRPPKAR